jgi:putative thioredoxin
LPDFDEIEQRLVQNPLDLDALLQKSRHLTARGEYDDAMTCLLTIMRNDRSFKDDIGRVSLLELFDLLGGEHPSVQTYRRKLFTLLH